MRAIKTINVKHKCLSHLFDKNVEQFILRVKIVPNAAVDDVTTSALLIERVRV